MGFLQRLLRARPEPPEPSVPEGRTSVWLNPRGWIPIVGESQYQEAIAAAVGVHCPEGHEDYVTVCLVTEPTNPHDPNAVVVFLSGRRVGYLDRSTASEFQPIVHDFESRGLLPICCALVNGGFIRSNGTRGYFGVILMLAPAAECAMSNTITDDHMLHPGDRTVTVTREEHYQGPLERYGPDVAVWVTLHWRDSGDPHAKSSSRPVIEVRLDGECVGFLTAKMSEDLGDLLYEESPTAVVGVIRSENKVRTGTNLNLKLGVTRRLE